MSDYNNLSARLAELLTTLRSAENQIESLLCPQLDREIDLSLPPRWFPKNLPDEDSEPPFDFREWRG